jgi:hypothetical protein
VAAPVAAGDRAHDAEPDAEALVGRVWRHRPWASILSGFQGMWLLEKFEIPKNREGQ